MTLSSRCISDSAGEGYSPFYSQETQSGRHKDRKGLDDVRWEAEILSFLKTELLIQFATQPTEL